MPKFICKFNKNYEIFVEKVYKYIIAKFAKDFDLATLNEIEIVDSLSGMSDGRMIDADKILLSKRLYDLLPILDIDILLENDAFNSLTGVLFHELCHINEQKIMPNIHAMCYRNVVDIDHFVCLFWIEYIVETKTNVILHRNKSAFCDDVALCEWNISKCNYCDNDTSNYFYLIKVLPYVLAYFYDNDVSTYAQKIKNGVVRDMVLELYDIVSQLKKQYPFDDVKFLYKIKHVFVSYKKHFS